MVLALLVLFAPACRRSAVNKVVKQDTDPETVPTMVSNNVSTVISDSGHTRYRITAPLWLMFETAKKPHWTFPKGVMAEELDDAYQVVSTIRSDSAYFDKNSMLWELHGNVRITNADNDRVLTDRLYWDQYKHRLYSESFIHIEKQGRIIEGYGYESNEKFTTYRLTRVEAIFPVDEDRMPRGG